MNINNTEIKPNPKGGNYLLPLILVTSLFFFWGFIHNLDPILIPHLKKVFTLNDLETAFVDFSVFIAYFIMALPAGYFMRRYGYKNGIIIGLVLFAIGSFLFIPAANTQQYVFFLGALFVIACGLTFLETAANPYVTILGKPETATQRLNFSQSFNGLAAFLAPVIGGKFILSDVNYTEEQLAAMLPEDKKAYLIAEAATVKGPYLVLGILICIITVLVLFTKLPDIKHEEESNEGGSIIKAFRHRHLKWAVIAQFFYIGAQICVLSFFIRFVTTSAGISQSEATWYAGGAGLAFMLGRFGGTFLMQFLAPHRLLMLYAAISALLSVIAIFGSGMITVYALIGVAFFMSVMFPTIFSLGISGLGHDTKIGSSLIVMSIVGGAVLPLGLGYISDVTGSIQYGYLVPLACFLVVFIYAFKFWKPINNNTLS
ncbi:fucose permease [Flavobacterium akiainvivens]|uniref:Fucose permease n=1 Tax=Flavobacterium akiainvivens TaxID=1202724 RepID=A0A0M8MC74_9FLAO|nr:L-fucose:H+ symporter permease [Flavobacterium akiainvivens]KOS05724.1 fucose permease [Flavobacterium akiainvivens]SFQ37368.1 MFS transporter, FHS family, L-fucose permease [Flavobacterium akiainvivens]